MDGMAATRGRSSAHNGLKSAAFAIGLASSAAPRMGLYGASIDVSYATGLLDQTSSSTAIRPSSVKRWIACRSTSAPLARQS